MTEYPTKTVDISDGTSETVYIAGHPRQDAVRVDSDEPANETLTVTFKPATDDDPENIDPSSLEPVNTATIAPTDSYTGAGTTAVARTSVVELDLSTGSGGDTLTVEVKAHPASDPAETGHSFAYKNTAHGV